MSPTESLTGTEKPALKGDGPAVRLDHVTKSFASRKVLDDV